MSPCNFHLAQLTELPNEYSSQKIYKYCILPLHFIIRYSEGRRCAKFRIFEVMCNFDRLLINKKISVDNICGWGFIWPNECLFTVMFGIQSREKIRQQPDVSCCGCKRVKNQSVGTRVFFVSLHLLTFDVQDFY